MIDIWLPTYGRADKLAAVAKNIEETTKNPFTLYFGVEPGDTASIEAARATGHEVVINPYEMGYSNTIQAMYEMSNGQFAFHANDDFVFLPGWDEQPIAMFDDPKIMMVGVKQREDDMSCSAICFWRRAYIEERSGVLDMPNRVFYPYHHNYQDTESTRTAQARGVWAQCLAPCIIHQHPGFTGKPKDDTYKKNDATSELDRQIFEGRKHLWENYNKEDDMAKRKPMSEEQKKHLSDLAKARAAAKKAQAGTDAPAAPADEVPAAQPPAESTEAPQEGPEAPQEPETTDTPATETPSEEPEADDEAADGDADPASDTAEDDEALLEGVRAARNKMYAVTDEHPEMIEAKQALNALDDAIVAMGHVRHNLSKD